MSYPYSELEAAGVDIASLVNEVFLNNFSTSHHKTNFNIYQGVDHTDQLGDRVEIKYTVSNPLKFDLNPISKSRFRSLYEAHLVAKGMDLSKKAMLHTIPANLKITSKGILFEIAVIDANTGTDIVRVPFNWDMEARCAVCLKETNGNYSVSLDPLKIEFSAGETAILQEIRKALIEKKKSEPLETPESYKSKDPDWCIKIERLILLLVNKVISVQLSNFIRSWELPKAIELVDGVDFRPSYLDVKNDYLAIGGHVTMSPIIESSLQAKATAILSEYVQRAQAELDEMTDEEIKKIKSAKLKSAEWLRNITKNLGMEPVNITSPGRGSKAGKNFDKNVSLLLNDKPIDYVAKKELSVRSGANSSTSLDRVLKAEAGWWLNVHSVSGGVKTGGLWVKATPDVGGYARICHFDVDPKNFGHWKCYGPAVQIIIKSAKIDAYPSFETDGIYVRGRFSSDGIEVRIPGWPSWANDLLAWVTRTLSDPIIDFLGALLSLLRVKIVSYPKHFPGTGLEWKPNVNVKPDNVGPYIEFSANPTFE